MAHQSVISPSQDLVFQMSNFRGVSDSEFYYGQLPDNIKATNFPLIGTVNWNGDFLNDKSLKLRYSVSYGHQTTDKGVWIVSLGHSYRKPKLGGYIDLMWSRQGLDVSGIMSRSAAYSDGTPRTLQNTEYLTAVGYLHFFFSPSIAAFVKGGWECAGAASSTCLPVTATSGSSPITTITDGTPRRKDAPSGWQMSPSTGFRSESYT